MSGRARKRKADAARKRRAYSLTSLCNALGGKGVRNKKAHDSAVQTLLAGLSEHALRPTKQEPSRDPAGVGALRSADARVGQPDHLRVGAAVVAGAASPPRYIAAALDRDGVVPLTGEVVLDPPLLRRVQQACDEARVKG
jgi:hypothetical protein